VAHVFFARIGQLDRRALHLDGDLGGLLDHLVFQPVAETAAHVERMDGNPFRIDAGDLADIVLDEARDLCTGPDLGAVFIDPDDGADRFERGMGQVGRAVFGADDLAGFGNRDLDIAVIALAAVERILGEAVGKRLPVLLHRGRERGRAPFGFDRLGGLEGAPGVVGDGGDTAGDRDHLADAAHFQRLAGVKAVHRSGLGRVELDCGMDHAFDLVVDAIALRAGGLGDDVDALHRLADQAPLGRRAQLDVLRRLDPRGDRRQFRIGERSAVGKQHAAGLGPQLAGRCSGLLRSSQLEGFAGHGTGLAQLDEAIGNRCRATGDLHADGLHHRG
jgi:hypothetical protein